jgi:Holliday junction DNA helicase RuvA
MIAQIQGKLVEKNPTDLIIDCNGVGYEIKITLNTYTTLTDDEAIKVYTKLIVREDAQILYGFHTKEEREMFNLLISVSGIGPNTAMIMLSSLVPSEVAHAIQSDDVATIQSVKGIGAKTAQRVIIDLKGKVIGFSSDNENIVSTNNTNKFDALNALVSLGFDKNQQRKL